MIVGTGPAPGKDTPVIAVYFGDPKQGYLPHAIFANSNAHFKSSGIKHRETSERDWVSSYDVTGGVKNFRSLSLERNAMEYVTLHRDVHIRDSFYTDWNLTCRYNRHLAN